MFGAAYNASAPEPIAPPPMTSKVGAGCCAVSRATISRDFTGVTGFVPVSSRRRRTASPLPVSSRCMTEPRPSL